MRLFLSHTQCWSSARYRRRVDCCIIFCPGPLAHCSFHCHSQNGSAVQLKYNANKIQNLYRAQNLEWAESERRMSACLDIQAERQSFIKLDQQNSSWWDRGSRPIHAFHNYPSLLYFLAFYLRPCNSQWKYIPLYVCYRYDRCIFLIFI